MISIKEAARLTGKSDRTIHSLVKKLGNEKPEAISKIRNKFLIDENVLKENYKFIAKKSETNLTEKFLEEKIKLLEENKKSIEKNMKEQIEDLRRIIIQKEKHESELMESILRNDILLKQVHQKLIAEPENKKPWWRF